MNSPLEPDNGALRPEVPCTSQVSCLGPFREKSFDGVFVKHGLKLLTSLFVPLTSFYVAVDLVIIVACIC